jgi:hypothetical protein
MYHLFIFNWCVILYKIIVSENFREKFIKKIVIKLYYSYTTLNKEIGYVLIDEVHSIFDKYKVPFWLSEGTALGIFRDNDLISHDDDIDIGFHAQYYDKFINNIIPELHKNNYYINNHLNLYWIEKNNFIIDINMIEPNNVAIDKFFAPSNDVIPFLTEFYQKKWRNKIWNLPKEHYYEYVYGKDWMIPLRKKPSFF